MRNGKDLGLCNWRESLRIRRDPCAGEWRVRARGFLLRRRLQRHLFAGGEPGGGAACGDGAVAAEARKKPDPTTLLPTN